MRACAPFSFIAHTNLQNHQAAGNGTCVQSESLLTAHKTAKDKSSKGIRGQIVTMMSSYFHKMMRYGCFLSKPFLQSTRLPWRVSTGLAELVAVSVFSVMDLDSGEQTLSVELISCSGRRVSADWDTHIKTHTVGFHTIYLAMEEGNEKKKIIPI